MPKELVNLPSGFQIEIISFGGLDSHAGHLHLKRSPKKIPEATRQKFENAYETFLPFQIIPTLSSFLKDSISSFDTFIVLPSSSDDADPYVAALFDDVGWRDISDRFVKKDGYKAAYNAREYERTYEAISYNPDGFENTIQKLLIFDESFSTGGSVDAVIRRLRDSGMPESAQVTLVAPLRLKPKP